MRNSYCGGGRTGGWLFMVERHSGTICRETRCNGYRGRYQQYKYRCKRTLRHYDSIYAVATLLKRESKGRPVREGMENAEKQG